MYFDAFRSFSRFCGAMFLPPAVTMMSFLRSVILTKPSASISAMSPGVEPAVRVEHGGRRLGILVVAAEDRLAADHQLAVVGDPELEARERGADRSEAPARRRVRRRGRRALGEPVALVDPDADCVEELRDLLDERRPARRSASAGGRRAGRGSSRARAGRRPSASRSSDTAHRLPLLLRACSPRGRRRVTSPRGGA